MTRTLALALWMMTFVLPLRSPAASAAPAPPADSARAGRGIRDTVTVLPTVRVDADAPGAREREASGATTLRRAQIARFQPLTPADAMAATPGIEISRPGPWATRISLRGMSDERVLVLVDGVRLSSGLGHGAQTSLVAVDRLEQVDVEPGAGSSRHGSDALGGVVQFTTHRPLIGTAARSVFTLSARAAEPGGAITQFSRLRLAGPHVGGELSASLGRLQALATPDGTLEHSGYREQEVSGRLAARVGIADFDYEHTQHAAYDAELPAFVTPAGGFARYPLSSRELDRYEMRLGAPAGRVGFRLLGVQQHFRDHFNEVTVESLYVRRVLRSTRATDATTRSSIWSRNLQPVLTLGPAQIRGEWRREQLSGPADGRQTTRNTAGDVTYDSTYATVALPHARQEFRAVGANTGLDLPRALRLELGARYDWSRADNDSAAFLATPEMHVTHARASGDVGLSAALGPARVFGNVGSAFRIPTLVERYFDGYFHGGLRLFGNPELQPERTTSVELGVRSGEAAGGLLRSARASLYRSEIRDFIDIVYLDQVFGVARFQYDNVRRARHEGVEAEVEGRVRGVGLAFSTQFPRARDLDTDRTLARFGTARVTSELRVPLPRTIPAGQAVLQARWADAVRSDDADLRRAAHWTGAVELSSVVHGSRIALAVRNVTNARYQDPLSFIPGEGRTWSLSVRRDLALPHLSSGKSS